MVFKKKEKTAVEVKEQKPVDAPPVIEEEVDLSETDMRIEPPVFVSLPPSGRLTQKEIDTLKETVMVLTNLLKISNNIAMRRGIKDYINVLGPMSQEAPKE